MRTLQYFWTWKKKDLTTKSWKTHHQKLLKKNSNQLFFLPALTAETAQTKEFMFQIVAYRPTVYRTGVWVKSKKKWATVKK